MAAPNRNYELKQLQLLSQFPFIWLTNLTVFESIFFHLKYSICRPLDSATWGGYFSRLPLATILINLRAPELFF